MKRPDHQIATFGTNGHADFHPDRPSLELPSPERAGPPGFSLRDLEGWSGTIRIAMPTIVVAVGSTASDIVNRLMRSLMRAAGGLPRCVEYRMIDADTRAPTMDRSRFISTGVDGSGTNPILGKESYEKPSVRRLVRAGLQRSLTNVERGDPRFRTLYPARKVTGIDIVAGAGGTSGGYLRGVVEDALDVARARDVEEPRIRLTLIGPDISINDVTREVTRKQRELIPNTWAQNLAWVYGEIARGPGRIFSVQVVDDTNEQCTFATNSALAQMVSHALFHQLFGTAGAYVEARTRDHRGYGDVYGTSR